MADEPTYDTVEPEFDPAVPAEPDAGVGADDGVVEPPLEDAPTYDDVEGDAAPAGVGPDGRAGLRRSATQ